ncbi:MAG TPA: hydroxymyristoyl-ACP dehydratase [Cyclobacteriaceae bacterium]|jgi:3-hydroxyacyl-[acyl-carrier-protein] dehydratase|nr:hydroxymyristoyl-ACP dehydratase [Cyclobacteriaceae bacterium]
MLLNDFYRIDDMASQIVEGKTRIAVSLVIDKSHTIFKGHFPDMPVVPGVCMAQMIKEIVQLQFGKSFFISSASNMKFLSVLNPEENSEINADILVASNHNALEIEGKLFSGSVIFFKMKALLTDLSQD